MSDVTRVGVIGVGAQGALHVAAYAALETVEVVCVCDADPGRAEDVARRYGVRRWTADHRDLLAGAPLDLVSVATPEGLHVQAVLDSLDAGAHVLVEKPIALHLAEAEAMFDRARARARFLMPAHILRFDPRYTVLKERLAAGDLGRVVSISAKRAFPRLRAGAFHRGPLFVESSIHDIDMALWLTGSLPARAYGVQRATQEGLPEDAVWGILHLRDGTVVVLAAHWLLPDSQHLFVEAEAEVLGERGVCRVAYPAGALQVLTDTRAEQPDTGLWPLVHGHLGGALLNEVAYMVRCVRRGEAPTVITEEETLAGLRAALALQESAASGREQALSGPPGH